MRLLFVPGGTVKDSNNWSHNLQTEYSKMETPSFLTDKLDFPVDKTIEVHTGFKSE